MNLFRNSLGTAALVALAVLLLAPVAEASRSGLPAAIEPALAAPATPDQVLKSELSEPPERLRLFEDLRLPERPLELVEARKTASGVKHYDLGLNIRQTGGLGRNCSGLSFQGLWTDPVTGISYARNRWYDARTASWLSEDPLGAVDSPNLYAFVGWGPHMATDPMGNAKVDPAQPEWHHLLTQEEEIVELLAEAGVDVGDRRFGVLVEASAHRVRDMGAFYEGVENLHGAGWNDDILKIVTRLRNEGKLGDVDLLASRVRRLMESEKYKRFFEYSISAPMSYGDWTKKAMRGRPKWEQYYEALRERFAARLQNVLRKRATSLARVAAREATESSLKKKPRSRISRRASKAIPVLGAGVVAWSFYSDAEAIGLKRASLNALLDGVPFFGTGKAIIETTSGQNMINSEDEDLMLRQQLAFLCYSTGTEWTTSIVHPTLEIMFVGSVDGVRYAIPQSKFLEKAVQLGLIEEE